MIVYRRGDTMFHRLDPVTKTVWCLIISTWMLGLRDPVHALTVSLSVAVFSIAAAGLDLKKYFRLALIFGLGGIFLVLYQGFFRPGPGLDFFGIHLSYAGLSIGCAIILRTFGIVASALAFSTTTSPRAISDAMVKCRVPYRIAHVVYLALRFMPVTATDLESVRDAQTIRGVTGKKSIVTALVTLIGTEYRRVDEISIALETRAFGLYDSRTVLEPVRITTGGIILVAITAAFMIIHLAYLWL